MDGSEPPGKVLAPPPADMDRLKALRDDVAAAADVSGGLWLSYMFVLFYLLVAVGGVSHWNLFREDPVKLPILDVNLPLLGFCWVGPLLFLVVHAYVLLHYRMLALKSRHFAAAAARVGDDQPESPLVQQLPINVFVQMLAGPDDVRRGLTGLLLRSISWISLVIGPLLLLVFFELRFLPYHDEAVTWWQRIAVVLDFALLAGLWPKIITRKAEHRARWHGMDRVSAAVIGGLGLVAFVAVFLVATFPGEQLNRLTRHLPGRAMLIAGEIDPRTSRPTSPWTNRLVISGRDIVDHSALDTAAKIAAAPVTIILRRRHLEGAVFIDARLPRADFTGAYLQGASFNRARLAGGWFDHAELSGVQLDDAEAQGASFYQARMEGASARRAHLQGAPMAGALLQGAILDDATLAGASLASADLRGASLRGADLRGANLASAWAEAASFERAKLAGASFTGAFVWRADFKDAVPGSLGIRHDLSVPGPPSAYPCEGPPKDACDPEEMGGGLGAFATRYLAEGDDRNVILVRLGPGLDPAVHPDRETEILNTWKTVTERQPAAEPDRVALAALWSRLACEVDGAPFVLLRFLETVDDASAYAFVRGDPQVGQLAEAFLKDNCAASLATDDTIRMRLHEIAQIDAGPTPRAPLPPRR